MTESRSAPRPILILADRVLTPEGEIDAALRLEGGEIVAIGDPAPDGATVIDARGLLVAPALVDVHGDAFERQVSPRPGVMFPTDAAILDTDRQLAANGIATAYHALTLSWEPGLRSAAQAARFLDALDALRPRLAVEHRVQLRWETFCDEALPVLARALAGPATPSLAFNDHTSMYVRPFGQPVQDRAPDFDLDRPTLDWDDPRLPDRLSSLAARAGIDADAYARLLRAAWDRRGAVEGSIREAAAMAAAAGAPIFSHDDNSPALRAWYRGFGARIAEFPMTVETARAARAAGDAIVFGSPNAARGGSHLGSTAAGDMVEAGLCDMLASDYFYPAMLAAVARLTGDGRATLPAAWALVSGAPARASGLPDRGEIAVGRRADLVAVEWPAGQAPTVRLTLSAGRIAHLAGLTPR